MILQSHKVAGWQSSKNVLLFMVAPNVQLATGGSVI
jgi:hypothetical protein